MINAAVEIACIVFHTLKMLENVAGFNAFAPGLVRRTVGQISTPDRLSTAALQIEAFV